MIYMFLQFFSSTCFWRWPAPLHSVVIVDCCCRYLRLTLYFIYFQMGCKMVRFDFRFYILCSVDDVVRTSFQVLHLIGFKRWTTATFNWRQPCALFRLDFYCWEGSVGHCFLCLMKQFPFNEPGCTTGAMLEIRTKRFPYRFRFISPPPTPSQSSIDRSRTGNWATFLENRMKEKNKMNSVRFVIGSRCLCALFSLFTISILQCAGTERNYPTQWLIYGMATDNEFHHDSIELLLFFLLRLWYSRIRIRSSALNWGTNMDGCVLECHEIQKLKIKLIENFNVGQFRDEKQKCQIQPNRYSSIHPIWKLQGIRPYVRHFILQLVHQMFVSHRFIFIQCIAEYSRPSNSHLLIYY